jgi:hypothetical protein
VSHTPHLATIHLVVAAKNAHEAEAKIRSEILFFSEPALGFDFTVAGLLRAVSEDEWNDRFTVPIYRLDASDRSLSWGMLIWEVIRGKINIEREADAPVSHMEAAFDDDPRLLRIKATRLAAFAERIFEIVKSKLNDHQRGLLYDQFIESNLEANIADAIVEAWDRRMCMTDLLTTEEILEDPRVRDQIH